MRVSIVVAAAQNGVIGKDGDLPWRLPADLRFFKKLTMGHPLIMGRKTHESIGRPLPGRRNLVVTRNPAYQAEGCEIFLSLGEALKACIGLDEVFVVGGGSIYEKAFELDMIDRIYLTEVHAEVEGDTFFKIPSDKLWRRVEENYHDADEKNTIPWSFVTLDRES